VALRGHPGRWLGGEGFVLGEQVFALD